MRRRSTEGELDHGRIEVNDGGLGDSLEHVKGVSVLGMWLFIVALGMLFAASLAGYFVIRLRAEQWPPAGMGGLPLGLYFSTFVLIGSSLTMQGALDSARRGRQALLKLMSAATLALGIVFLLSQILAWRVMLAAQAGVEPNLYSFTFYMLTALHAAHVFFGLIPLGVTTAKAFKGAYHPGWSLPVKLMGLYWHFLLLVWLVMFAVMMIAG